MRGLALGLVLLAALGSALVGCGARGAVPAAVPVREPSAQPAPIRAVVPAGRGAWALALAPGLRRAYVTNREKDTLTIVDLDRNAVAATVSVGPDPHNVAVDEATRRVFVTLHGGTSAARGDAVAVLDASDGAALATWPAGAFPAQIALDADLGQLYVVNEGVNTLTILDLRDGAILGQVAMPGNPTDLAVSPATGRVYVTDWVARQVLVVDGRTRAIVAQAPVGPMPLRVAVSPVGEHVYVADGTSPGADSGALWTLDGQSLASASRPVAGLPMGVAVEPESGEVLVTDARRGTLTIFDTAGQTVLWEAGIGAAPHAVAGSRALGAIYVVLSGSSSLAVLDWPLPR